MNFSRLPSLLLGAACLVLSGTAAAQFPDKPIRFVVPFASGTATDQIARAFGQAITAETKQQVIIDNKPGGNGFIGAVDAVRSAPDGYTVLIATNTTHAAAEHMFKKVPYDPVKDFEPITGLGTGGQVMVVNSQSPYHSVQDFIAAAKKDPGKLTFAAGSSSSRIASEMLLQLAGIQVLHVPYKSNTFAVTDLLGGQVDMMIPDTATGLPHVKSGKLRALGISTKKRSPLVPEVPTMEEAGVRGYEMTYWFAAYAPAHTPPAVVKRLNDLFAKAAKTAVVQSFYTNAGVDAFITSPEGLHKFQTSEAAKWGEIIRKAGIQKE